MADLELEKKKFEAHGIALTGARLMEARLLGARTFTLYPWLLHNRYAASTLIEYCNNNKLKVQYGKFFCHHSNSFSFYPPPSLVVMYPKGEGGK